MNVAVDFATHMESASTNPKSYGQILKSSAVIGGSSAVTLVLGMVRAKAIALLLGTGGYGLWGICNSIVELSQTIVGMGMNGSGVRQIAEATGSGDEQRIARTVITLRRVSRVLGAVGAILLAVFSRRVALFSFGDAGYAPMVAVLSLTVLCNIISQGQNALLQGVRRIADMAKDKVLGAIFSTLVCIPIIYFFRERGIAWALVSVAGFSVLTSWFFARRVKVVSIKMRVADFFNETGELFKLGAVFLTTGLMVVGVNYCINIILMRRMDANAVGLYGAAWLVGGYFAGFVLQAMGTDFYPRLTAIAGDHAKCNQLVNEQTEIGILLAGPGMVATLTFAPWAIQILQSAKFLPAVDVLRWISLGILLRVIAWPMGFIMLAKNAKTVFFLSELGSSATYLAMVWFAVGHWGVNGVGMAFVAMYVLYIIAVYAISRKLTGFIWSRASWQLISSYLTLALVVSVAFYFLGELAATIIGVMVMSGMAVYSIRKIASLLPPERFPRRFRRLLVKLRVLD